MAFEYIVHRYLSPRIIEVLSPTTDITVQEIVDACRDWEDSTEGIGFPRLIDAAGKEELGGGVTVGITATLQNAQIMFTGRTTPIDDGSGRTCDATDATGKELYVDDADFVNDGVYVGCTAFNDTTKEMATVTEVTDLHTLQMFALTGAGGLGWTNGNSYMIYPNVQCSITGGNLVAVDTNGDSIDAVLQSPNCYVRTTSSSSATLQELSSIQYSSFNGGVTLDTASSYSGVEFPVGTPQEPVNNLADAMTIANNRGFTTIYVLGDITIDSGADYSDMTFVGESQTKSTFTIDAAANVENCEFYDAAITGTLDGNAKLRNCLLQTLNYINGMIEQCILSTGTITLGGSLTAHFLDCWSGAPDTTTPVIDLGGSGQPLAMRNYNGGITLQNKTGSENVNIDLNSGQIRLKDTVTGGKIVCRGVGKLIDDDSEDYIPSGTHNGATIVNELITPMIDELHKLQGLDAANPMTVTPTSRVAGSISQTISGDGEMTTTVTRD